MNKNKNKKLSLKETTPVMHVKEKCLDCWRCKKIRGVWRCPWDLFPWLTPDKKFVNCNGFIDRLPRVAPARKAYDRERKNFQMRLLSKT